MAEPAHQREAAAIVGQLQLTSSRGIAPHQQTALIKPGQADQCPHSHLSRNHYRETPALHSRLLSTLLLIAPLAVLALQPVVKAGGWYLNY
jgi:hypothetical protein